MGVVRAEMLRLENERQVAEEASCAEYEEILAAQIKAMRGIVAALAEDQDDLRQLGVLLINPETGIEIDHRDPSLRGVTIVDATHRKGFADVTLEFHFDTNSFSAVEWRAGETPGPGADPFERQRVNFNSEAECLRWLANFLFQHVNLEANPWRRKARNA